MYLLKESMFGLIWSTCLAIKKVDVCCTKEELRRPIHAAACCTRIRLMSSSLLVASPLSQMRSAQMLFAGRARRLGLSGCVNGIKLQRTNTLLNCHEPVLLKDYRP